MRLIQSDSEFGIITCGINWVTAAIWNNYGNFEDFPNKYGYTFKYINLPSGFSQLLVINFLYFHFYSCNGNESQQFIMNAHNCCCERELLKLETIMLRRLSVSLPISKSSSLEKVRRTDRAGHHGFHFLFYFVFSPIFLSINILLSPQVKNFRYNNLLGTSPLKVL